MSDRALILLAIAALVIVTALVSDTNRHQTSWLDDVDWENQTQSLDIGEMESQIDRLQQRVDELEAGR